MLKKIPKILKTISPEWFLRIGLGIMYLYSGFSLFTEPLNWQGFIPLWLLKFLGNFADTEVFLKIQGIGELFLALFFLAWFIDKRLTKAAAYLAAGEMALIIALVGIDLITFRDIGLLGAALALSALLSRSASAENKNKPIS